MLNTKDEILIDFVRSLKSLANEEYDDSKLKELLKKIPPPLPPSVPAFKEKLPEETEEEEHKDIPAKPVSQEPIAPETKSIKIEQPYQLESKDIEEQKPISKRDIGIEPTKEHGLVSPGQYDVDEGKLGEIWKKVKKDLVGSWQSSGQKSHGGRLIVDVLESIMGGVNPPEELLNKDLDYEEKNKIMHFLSGRGKYPASKFSVQRNYPLVGFIMDNVVMKEPESYFNEEWKLYSRNHLFPWFDQMATKWLQQKPGEAVNYFKDKIGNLSGPKSKWWYDKLMPGLVDYIIEKDPRKYFETELGRRQAFSFSNVGGKRKDWRHEALKSLINNDLQWALDNKIYNIGWVKAYPEYSILLDKLQEQQNKTSREYSMEYPLSRRK